MRLETELAQMDLIVLNSDHFGLVLVLETKEITWDHHPVSLNNQWRDWWDDSFCGGSYHTHLSQEATIHPLAELLFSAMTVKAAEGHGLTGQLLFGQLQVDKMIPTLNDSIMIPEKYYNQIWTHCISPPHVCLLIKKTKSSFSFLFNVCDPWHMLYQVAVNQISTKSVLETMALLGLLRILGIGPQFPSSKERLPTLWSTKYNLGPAVLY